MSVRGTEDRTDDHGESPRSKDGIGAIPKIIHQSYKTRALPRAWRASRRAWKALHPDWEYKFWTDEDNLRLVETHYPHLLELYLSYEYPIMRADFARYCVLDHWGGVYCDLDQEPLRAIDPMFEGSRCEAYFGTSSYTYVTNVTNSIMASVPGAGVWRAVFAELKRATKDSRLTSLNRHFYVMTLTGPLMLTRALTTYRSGPIGMLPTDFNPHDGDEDGGGPPKNRWMRKLAGSGSWHNWDSRVLEFVMQNTATVLVVLLFAVLIGLVVIIIWLFLLGRSVVHGVHTHVVTPLAEEVAARAGGRGIRSAGRGAFPLTCPTCGSSLSQQDPSPPTSVS